MATTDLTCQSFSAHFSAFLQQYILWLKLRSSSSGETQLLKKQRQKEVMTRTLGEHAGNLIMRRGHET